ncbi:LytR/AlgR family response regulator transcription factor [Pelagibaculum spongiae]|uniref:DNA-binding response regulator n=1 Tax=Pelagibaculum spongiae TaxID=2080658 RepID=A0A2V1H1S9_9GAMM|nr:LytTR family DNA-binding domain-containing protein [Pelagibaculum spongiae]PVZ70331.1 DNA-binding response regulator [Pelagibaculum spongiae]
MKILIVDDEPLARDRLIRLLEENDGVEVVGQAGGGREALEKVQLLQPEIVMLDISMPGMDGLEVARHLQNLEQAPAIVFVTAYDEYALQAFEVEALDYLVKPVRKERLTAALERASKPSLAQLKAANGQAGHRRSHISARHRGGIQLIPLDDIFYFQADHKYVTLRHKGGEVLIEEPLKDLENEFTDLFMRIHRNALVSKQHIVRMEKGQDGRHRICFRDMDDQLEVSRRHVSGVRKMMQLL